MSDDVRTRLDRHYDLLEQELDGDAPHLGGEAREAFFSYYGKLLSLPSRRRFYHYNWLGRVAPFAQRLAAVARQRDEVRVFDAECGCGTECMLWSALAPNVRVLGADADPARLAAARARLHHYRSALGPLAVRFEHEDVFSLLAPDSLDAVWVMEAISHIEPPGRFLAEAARALRRGGLLAVSDSNLLNPAMAAKVWRLRRRQARGRALTTASGAQVCSAPEALLSIGQVKRMLEASGLAVDAVRRQVFFPPAVAALPPAFAVARAWDGLAARVPVLRGLAGIYTVVARKP